MARLKPCHGAGLDRIHTMLQRKRTGKTMFENFNGPTINGKSGRGVDFDAQLQRSKGLLKLAGVAAVLVIGTIIFFNYIAAVTRIGAGYVGVEVVLSGSQRGASGDSDPHGMGVLQPAALADHRVPDVRADGEVDARI